MSGFGSALAAEASKFRSLWDTRLVVALVLLGCAAWAFLMGQSDPTSLSLTAEGFLPGRGVAQLSGLGLMLTGGLGALIATSEYGSGTLHTTMITVPDRRRVLAAKALVGASAGLVLGIVAAGTMVLALGAGAGHWAVITEHPDVTATLAGRTGLGFAVVSLMGVGLGFLFRTDLACWTLLLLWPILAERVLASLPGVGPVVGPWLPFRGADYFILGSSHGAPYAWGSSAAILVTLAWAVGLGALAAVAFVRPHSLHPQP